MAARPNELLAAFEARRRRDPAAAVVVAGQRSFTAGALDDLAHSLSSRLPASARGALVGLRAPNGPAFLAAWIALLRHGAAPLLHDCRQPEAEARRVAASLGAAGIWFSSSAWPASADEVRWIDLALEGGHRADLAPHLAAVKLTSGSTGAPRGIAVGDQALLADESQLHSTMGLGERERRLTAIPLSHSYGLASLAAPALIRDTTLVLADQPGPLAPVQAAAAHAATFFPTSPSWLGPVSRLHEPPPFPESLRLVISAGEPLAAETAARLRQRLGRRVHVFYGSSETGGITFDRAGDAAERESVGSPIDGVTVTLTGPDSRVAVASAAVGTGYLPEPNDRLGGGRFVTSDLGAWNARGELCLLGRVDDLVFVKGKGVNPREIEAVLRRAPGVEEAAVLGLPGSGEGQRLCAVVAAANGVTAAAALAFCRSNLAEHQVPRTLRVVAQLPRGERGKLDRAALRALLGG
jgi:long-chain acyl-CoA synthetase